MCGKSLRMAPSSDCGYVPGVVKSYDFNCAGRAVTAAEPASAPLADAPTTTMLGWRPDVSAEVAEKEEDCN